MTYDPRTRSRKFRELRDRYLALMDLPIGEPTESHVWIIQVAAIFDEAQAEGIDLDLLTYTPSGLYGGLDR